MPALPRYHVVHYPLVFGTYRNPNDIVHMVRHVRVVGDRKGELEMVCGVTYVFHDGMPGQEEPPTCVWCLSGYLH